MKRPVTADKTYQELLKATNYEDMTTLSERWKDESPAFRDALCMMLLDHLRSKDLVAMVKQGDRSDRHDLRMVGGRCAWAIEKLLKCGLPQINQASTHEEVSEVRRIVLKTMGEIHEKEADKAADELTKLASPSDKVGLARSTDISPHVLARLADEKDVDIRRAVAANPQTPPSVLARLAAKDVDDEVRSKAVKNLEVARTVVNEKKNKPQ